ncbi:MAG TPA: succinate dehydrogenase/fumarate reductase flavoprotein subunit, partial [Psychrobacter sp.]|nr:succinate dehydrogenase/fumarate reductase flavoprotein subunit [Psychrobacter sp.]
YKPIDPRVLDYTVGRLNKLQQSTSGYNAQEVADEIRATMQKHASVFRTQALMDEGVEKLLALQEKVDNIHLADKSQVFNTARIEALEVANLYEVAKATMLSASKRKECRGAHTVLDYERPEDDAVAPNGRNDN